MAERKVGIGIIGCGLIGEKRAAALDSESLRACFDIEMSRAETLAKNRAGCRVYDSVAGLLDDPSIEMVVVATRNDALAELTGQALLAGKHVLVEKPGAISVAQVEQLLKTASQTKRLVRVGFNHRYHPALLKARELFNSGLLGDLMFIRGRYGHGGRIGYEREWRADPKLSGGGELIDQGVHLIDLAGWFLGSFPFVHGRTHTYYWNMPVEDNAFLHLETATGQAAWLQVSCSEWKNLFSFEIYGKHAKLHIEGLGGSYGVERLTVYEMLPEMWPPITTVHEYPRGDVSWRLEMEAFIEDIKLGRTPSPGLKEAQAALAVVEEVYHQSSPLPPGASTP